MGDSNILWGSEAYCGGLNYMLGHSKISWGIKLFFARIKYIMGIPLNCRGFEYIVGD